MPNCGRRTDPLFKRPRKRDERKKHFDRWMRNTAKEIFAERLSRCTPRFKGRYPTPPRPHRAEDEEPLGQRQPGEADDQPEFIPDQSARAADRLRRHARTLPFFIRRPFQKLLRRAEDPYAGPQTKKKTAERGIPPDQ